MGTPAYHANAHLIDTSNGNFTQYPVSFGFPAAAALSQTRPRATRLAVADSLPGSSPFPESSPRPCVPGITLPFATAVSPLAAVAPDPLLHAHRIEGAVLLQERLLQDPS